MKKKSSLLTKFIILCGILMFIACFITAFMNNRQMMITMQKESHMSSDIGDDLSSNMGEAAAAINEITANIQSIKG